MLWLFRAIGRLSLTFKIACEQRICERGHLFSPKFLAHAPETEKIAHN